MPAPVVNIDLKAYQSCTFSKGFIWKQGADPSTATPVDLTGYTAQMAVRGSPDARAATILVSPADITITLGTTDGSIQISIVASKLESPPFGVYYYDLILQDGSGNRVSFARGNFTLAPVVVRA